jgi:hypothetical protein
VVAIVGLTNDSAIASGEIDLTGRTSKTGEGGVRTALRGGQHHSDPA